MLIALKELSELVDIPVRTIRFYIQKGLVDRPIGERKAAKYSDKHVEQCLQVKKWSSAGLSLDAIANAFQSPPEDIPEPPKKPGQLSVINSIYIAKGVTLQVDTEHASLNHEQIQAIINSVIEELGR
ncbi:hypothetical protein BCS96_08765 [Vibrio breoganii]|uniref:helix-turn-helix domain-containing protein n=1 Tax=Vibrio breoganii TaxID=553239 RepID=UPI00080DFF54|nr:helix-turn-helix domain-containing protein [Vibrio breoganii]OCH77812.1 hypothetical protein A6D95_05415 [Vibrio breoganii]PMG10036.1 hypothetical protein BCV00_04105 [Vibrio breoganii]PML23447.1 hypothetical protein BCT82_15110 [Vibrio breoganii]PML80275.1 hypothetical protein BCT68_15825 [Vibrio breoganii]PMO69304.1 hypothetical protein BCT04_04845 [Vibrio breoganii]